MAWIALFLLLLTINSALSLHGLNDTDVIVDEKILSNVLNSVNGVYMDSIKAAANSGTVLATAW